MESGRVRELDETTRPRASRGLPLTEAQQQPGRHLRAIHDHFRSQLVAVVDAVADVRRGEASLGEVRAAVHQLAHRATYEQLGSFCGQLCQLVTMHHGIEDRAMFPAVAVLPDYVPVVERLMDEHLVVHERLVGIDSVLVRMHTDESAFDDLATAVAALSEVLLSHFRYEEDEMGEAMGLAGLMV
jgi:hypothetical protein